MSELISVIVPIYKVENFLPFCIESIQKQTYENLEIILVDDGSTDNCGRICDQYAASDIRIKVIHKENSGVSDSRNTGIDIATGTYIAFVDGDDCISQNYIEVLYDILIKYSADIAVCKYIYIYENEKSISGVKRGVSKVISQNEAIMHSLNSHFIHSACCKLYRSNLLKNIRFPVGKVYAEDISFSYSVLLQAKKIAETTAKLYQYRIRKDSAMHVDFHIAQYEEIEIIEQSMSDIEKIYPELKYGIKCRKMISYFGILRIILLSPKKDMYKNLRKELREKIRISSKGLLLRRNIPLKLKIKIASYKIGGEELYIKIQKIADIRNPFLLYR